MRCSLLFLLLGCLVLSACTNTNASDGGTDQQPVAEAEEGAVHIIEDLDHVETSVFALGSVWAVTSNRPDRFSAAPVQAGVVRIDPSTRLAQKVLDSPGVEPTVSELDDKLWVSLVDRIVALDDAGSEVASISFNEGDVSDQIAGTTHLWALNFTDGTVSVIDPSTTTVVRVMKTGDFPVSPISAFGHVWIPSSLDGTVTIIDEETLGNTVLLTPFVTAQQLEDVTAVRGGLTGDEVWVTTREGDVFAITAHGADFGQVRQVDIDSAINRVHIHDGRAFLLPIAGRSVLVLDLETEDVLARISTDSIPFRATIAHDLVWVAGDGMAETLTVIDPESLAVRTTFQIGSNQSNTNGPHTPFPVASEIWIPNRGDSRFFIITADGF